MEPDPMYDDALCPCGADYAPEARFCGACGAERALPVTDCPGCGAACEGMNFCPMCGDAVVAIAATGSRLGPLAGAVTIARVHLLGAAVVVVVAMIALGTFRLGGGGESAVAAEKVAATTPAAAHGDAAADNHAPAPAGDAAHAEGAGDGRAEAGDAARTEGTGDEHAPADDAHAKDADTGHGTDAKGASADDDAVAAKYGLATAGSTGAAKPAADHGDGHAEPSGEVVAVAGDDLGAAHGAKPDDAHAPKAKAKAKAAKPASRYDRLSRRTWLARPASTRLLTILRWLEEQGHGPCDALPVTEVETEVTRYVRSHRGPVGTALRATCG